MISLVFSFKHSLVYKDLKVSTFLEELQEYLPVAYRNSNMFVWLSPNNLFLTVSWQNSKITDGLNRNSYIQRPIFNHPLKGWLVATGHTHKNMLQSKKDGVFPYLFELMDVSTTGLKLLDSPGGSGTYSWISPHELSSVSWNTQPPVFPLFVGKNHDDFCVVGNRVLLVAMASQLSTKFSEFNKDFSNSYISVGYALNNSTMYKNVEMLPANKSVTCKKGEWRYTDYPVEEPEEISSNLPLEEKSSLLASALIKSFDVLNDFDSSMLWLSGGKDSRTLAAVYCFLNMKLRSISFGSTECEYAELVVNNIKSDYQIHDMHVISNPITAAIASNKVTEGLGTSVAHQFNFQYPSFKNAPVYVHGQGHLLRGGFARHMKYNWILLNNRLKSSFVSDLTTKKANKLIFNDLKKWERTRKFRDRRDKLYWANHDFRLGAYTAPGTMDMTGKAVTLFPLIDEKVSRIASGLCFFDRVTERVLFGAIEQLCPKLSELPLYKDEWRFDRFFKNRKFVDSSHNFDKTRAMRCVHPRIADNKSKHLIRDNEVGYAESLIMRSQAILDSSIFDDTKLLVRPEILAVIRKRATGNMEESDYLKSLDANTRFTLENLINRMFIAGTLYDANWI